MEKSHLKCQTFRTKTQPNRILLKKVLYWGENEKSLINDAGNSLGIKMALRNEKGYCMNHWETQAKDSEPQKKNQNSCKNSMLRQIHLVQFKKKELKKPALMRWKFLSKYVKCEACNVSCHFKLNVTFPSVGVP